MSRFFLKYINSHIYDIYAILVGTITLAIVMILKMPIKRSSHKLADRKCGPEKEQTEEWKRIYKRQNGVIFLLVMVVAFLTFAVVAQISPQIDFSLGSAAMSVVYAIAEYEIIDRLI